MKRQWEVVRIGPADVFILGFPQEPPRDLLPSIYGFDKKHNERMKQLVEADRKNGFGTLALPTGNPRLPSRPLGVIREKEEFGLLKKPILFLDDDGKVQFIMTHFAWHGELD